MSGPVSGEPGENPAVQSPVPGGPAEGYLGTFGEIGGHPVRPWPRYASPKPQCQVCSVRTICEGCRHDEGCSWCSCDGNGCTTCGTKCRSHASRELWQEDVGTFDLWVDLRGQRPLSLPRYIPAVKPRSKMAAALPRWTYTISVNDLIRTTGTPREVAYRVREFFPKGSQLLLNFFGEDRYLEPIWTRGASFWDPEGEGSWLSQFDAIVAVNYSLYLDDSSFEIMHSLRRSYMAAQEIHDAGHTVIPLLSYVSEKQLAEQVEALMASGVETVCVNLQVVEGEKLSYQRKNIEYLGHIARNTPWRLIAYGLARRELVDELAGMFGDRLVLSNSGPYFHAMRRHKGQRRRTFTEELRSFTRLAAGAPPEAPSEPGEAAR